MRYGIRENQLKDIINILSKEKEISKVLLYGSRAIGNFKPGSDIDLALIGEDLTLSDLLRINVELDKLDLPYSFDINIYNKIKNKELIDHIDRIGFVLYEKNK